MEKADNPEGSVAPKKLSIGGQSVTPSVAPKKSSLSGKSVQSGPPPSVAPKKTSLGGQSVQGGPAPSVASKKSSLGGQSVQSDPPPSVAPKKLSIGGESVRSGASGAAPPSVAPKKLSVGEQSVQGAPTLSVAPKKVGAKVPAKKTPLKEAEAGEATGEEDGEDEDGEYEWEFDEDAAEYDTEEEEEGTEGEGEEELTHHAGIEDDDEELIGIDPVKIARDSVLTFAKVAELGNLLSKVKLVWPEDLVGYNEKEYISDPSRQGLRRSYYTCSEKEKAVLWHAENFRKQFHYHHPNRRPLYIAPKNQCGIQKLFPTFLSVGCTRYRVLYEPEACVKFFTDFFNPDFLEPATDVPTFIRSHDYVIKHRKANAFEISIIIASLLIGAGYDAYVCDGYACVEFTTLCSNTDYVDDFTEPYDYFDEGAPPRPPPVRHTKRGRKRKKTLEFGGGDAEYNDEEHAEGAEEEESEEKKKEDLSLVVNSYFNRDDDDSIPPVSPSKYKLRGKKQFKSKFEEVEAEKAEVKRLEEEVLAIKQAEEERLLNVVPPEKDKLFGFRIHSWVVVKPKPEDDFEEPFFLEPFTGTKRAKSDPGFIGIEAVFNEKNYWINMQGCTESCAELSFDLEEKEKWAQFLVEPAAFKELRKPKPKPENDLHQDDEEEEQIVYPPMYLDMPVTWTKDLNISESDYLTKYPGGKKTYQHNDAVVERSAAYSNPDGMVRKVLKFKGNSRKASDLLFIEERFEKRTDKLGMRKWYKKGRILHEYFEKGRHDALKEHIHVAGKNQPHHPRHLYYYANAHPENASHRQVLDKGLVEHFEGRDDFLYYRFTAFGAVLCETVPEKEEKSKTVAVLDYIHGDTRRRRPRRKIIGIIEKYLRNPEKEVRDDISEKYILIDEGRFRIVFHYGDEDYTRATLEFFKAAVKSQVMKAAMDFKPEDSIEYRVDPFTAEMTNFKKYQFLKQLKADQEISSDLVRAAEDEITNTVLDRVQEDWKHELEPKPRALREQEAAAAEKHEEEEKLELDFASPYLEQYIPRNKEEELLLKRKIMEDFKERIFRKIEIIQKNYAMESALLKDLKMQPDNEEDELDEDGCISTYEQALVRMQVMEERILRIREKAPGDYCSLLIQVIQHPLLNRFSEEEKRIKAAEIVQQGIEQMEEAKKLELAKRRKSCCTLTYFHKFKERKPENLTQEESDRASLYV